jgi:type VI secretion system secreted protein VgrG
MARIVGLSIAGIALEVATLRGTIELSRTYELRVEAFARGDMPAIADLLGQTYELTITDTHGNAVIIRGVTLAVEQFADAVVEGGRVDLLLGSPVAPLGLGRDSRVFQDLGVVDIVSKVIERGGVADVEWRTSASYPTRPYTVQYRESDWDFVERLLIEEGIYYFFEHEDGATKIVFCDDSTTAADLDEGATLPFRDEGGLAATRDAVHRVRRRAALVHDAVRLRDYNQEKPRLSLDSKAGSGAHEVYDFPGRFQLPAAGDQLARVRLEGLQARRVVTVGEASTTRLRVGRVFELSEHPIDALNGRCLVERITYHASEPRAGAAQGNEGLHLAWEAIPAATPYRRPRQAPVTRDPAGLETGVVVGVKGEEIHPDKSGRIRVQHYWDREGQRDDKASTWMRVGQFPVGGSMVLPRIGWDVVVHHSEGDIDQPYVSSHLYDGQFPVPYPLPEHKTRTSFQTASTPGGGSVNEIRYEDKAGSEEMFINASKDMNVVVGDNVNEKVGVDFTETIGSNLDVKIGSNLKVGIKSDQSISIGASESLTVSASRAVAVDGSESTTIGASRSVTVSKGSTIEATAGRTHTVGGTMMAASALGVNRMVLGTLSMSVGGSWIRVAGTGLSTATAGACAETVGAAKIHAGAAGCSVSVNGAAAETVGGAYVIAAGGNVAESATSSLAFTVGGAYLANAPSIEIEATSEISIRVGASSLTITGSCVEVKSPLIAAPAAAISKKASKIEHN